MIKGGKETATIPRDDPSTNANALNDFYKAKNEPKNVPENVTPILSPTPTIPKDPGHQYAKTKHISFDFCDQRESNAPFGYEHYVSLPLAYNDEPSKTWPLILFLHGAGESQRSANESYASIRHGIPKIILCYNALKEGLTPPTIDIPRAPRFREKSKQDRQVDKSGDPVDPEVCQFVAENFITVTPSLNMEWGYGWNAAILSALLDEILERYRVDLDAVHVTGFSMGGYGTWELAMHSPNRFASLVPICGGGDVVRAALIKHVPHWVHHGEKDDIIPVSASVQMVEALEKFDKGRQQVRFTRYPELMHDSWTAAYDDLDVFKWILQQRRKQTGDEHVVPRENKAIVVQT